MNNKVECEWENDGFGNIFLVETLENGEENIPCTIKEPFGEGKEGWKVTRMDRSLSKTELQDLLNLIL